MLFYIHCLLIDVRYHPTRPQHIIPVLCLMIDGYYRIEWFELHTPLHAVLEPVFMRIDHILIGR